MIINAVHPFFHLILQTDIITYEAGISCTTRVLNYLSLGIKVCAYLFLNMNLVRWHTTRPIIDCLYYMAPNFQKENVDNFCNQVISYENEVFHSQGDQHEKSLPLL